ncbi:uncharacterized protein RCC_05330 [Ramularia collo-cygni]|uniref:Uncharacterized protein n=1 Tax=Ramularia collo-cygni TaxID=112498 RepID=A0A2D3VCV8_9PEZI|nr:uncharacterized protein RCC_05330 [Ramularia collo-cygni]CZT19479.1 uncharacterized protein RCC_05330 [Ramularia collo-cygni]
MSMDKAGVKRPAEESLDQDRFNKRFNLSLTLGVANGPTNHYIPVASTPPSPENRALRSASNNDDSIMQVDETRDRVFVYDLDAELADVDTEERGLVFLPDIEQYFSKLPKQVVAHKKDNDHEGQELVLYRVPKSLTVDEGRDSVRKAILDARQRAREKAAEEARQHDMNARYGPDGSAEVTETAHGYTAGYGDAVEQEQSQDPDAMDVD